jgi:hypothetical protein
MNTSNHQDLVPEQQTISRSEKKILTGELGDEHPDKLYCHTYCCFSKGVENSVWRLDYSIILLGYILPE